MVIAGERARITTLKRTLTMRISRAPGTSLPFLIYFYISHPVRRRRRKKRKRRRRRRDGK